MADLTPATPDTAIAIAEAVRAGERSAREVLDAHLAAIEGATRAIHRLQPRAR